MPAQDNRATRVATDAAPIDVVRHALESRGARVRTRGPHDLMVTCPAHDDANPSLSVKVGRDDVVLLHCHAGCPTEEVVAGLGLTMADLFVPRAPLQAPTMPRPAKPRPRVTATYVYTDEDGAPLYRVQRREPGRDGTGKELLASYAVPGAWKNGLPASVRRVPYRLPELLQAVRDRRPVFVVEGEKCADALHGLGLAATTNAGGATRPGEDSARAWRKDWQRFFDGATVVVLPDNDPAGLAHAQAVVEVLRPVAATLKVVELPNLPAKGDVVDWLEMGGTKEQLQELVLRTGPWTPPRTSLDRLREAAQGTDPVLDPAALYGLAGEAVRALEPTTEAGVPAMLVSLLAGFGSVVGRAAWVPLGNARHHPRLFAVVVGQTARARKGTSWAEVRSLLRAAAPEFFATRVIGGLSSGEGLIAALQDKGRMLDGTPQTAPDPHDPHPDVAESLLYGNNPFVSHNDTRALVVEPEYAKVLRVARREGSSLSAVLRDAWDGETLQVLTRGDPLKAETASVAMLGHVTAEELRAELRNGEAVNGYGNRFLYVHTARSRILAFPQPLPADVAQGLATRLATAMAAAQRAGETPLSSAAREVWAGMYEQMESAPDGSSMYHHLVVRGPAHTMRLALVYALLDRSAYIEPAHLVAAKALWDFADATAAWVWGNVLGDPRAEELLAALKAAGPEGIVGRDLHALFGRNIDAVTLGTIKALLIERDLAHEATEPTGGAGRPRTVLRYGPASGEELGS